MTSGKSFSINERDTISPVESSIATGEPCRDAGQGAAGSRPSYVIQAFLLFEKRNAPKIKISSAMAPSFPDREGSHPLESSICLIQC